MANFCADPNALHRVCHDIDEAIRNDMNLTLNKPDSEVKEKHGILELDNQPLRSGDLQRLSTSIKSVIESAFPRNLPIHASVPFTRLIPEDSQRNNTFCSAEERLFFAPAVEYFTQLINIPSQRLHLLEDQDPERASRPKEPLFATAVGIGMKVSARGKNAALIESINFRKGIFAFNKSLGDFEDKLWFIGKWVLVIFAVAFLQLLFRNYNLRHENSVVEKAAISEVKKIIPDDKSKSGKAALKKLETKIQELQQKQEVLTAGLNRTTALGILRQLSVLITEDIRVDTKELSIERNKITMRGDTDAFSSVDRIVTSLQTFPEFTRVEKGDVRDTSDGKKSFQLTILVGEEGEEKGKK
ncbi:MAG: hypothetical protein R2877_02665 [Bdellovibrionota bacterium]